MAALNCLKPLKSHVEIVVRHPKSWTRKHLMVLVHRQRHGTPSDFSISWVWEPGEDENNGNLNFSIATGTFETHVPDLKYLFVTVSQRTPLQLYYITIAPISGEFLSLETKEWQDGDKKLAVTQNIAESTNTSSNITFSFDYKRLNVQEIHTNLFEDPACVVVSAQQERSNGSRILRFAVGDEILSGILRVVRARGRRQLPHQLQHLPVRLLRCCLHHLLNSSKSLSRFTFFRLLRWCFDVRLT